MIPEPELSIFLKVYWFIVCTLDALLRPMIRPRDYCCKLLCFRKAEWTIESGSTTDDYTKACTRHVGCLLDDSSSFTVYPISNEE
jgi:hypothetical protein